MGRLSVQGTYVAVDCHRNYCLVETSVRNHHGKVWVGAEFIYRSGWVSPAESGPEQYSHDHFMVLISQQSHTKQLLS